tara:strand:- start:186 stop:425 length:240 start_codon:yes stop_codon:yes gene_type:complete
MAKLKLKQVKRIICPTCRGNGFVTVKNDFVDGQDYVHQCWDCDSEGEFYETVEDDNLIGDDDSDDNIIEWMRSLPVRGV